MPQNPKVYKKKERKEKRNKALISRGHEMANKYHRKAVGLLNEQNKRYMTVAR